MIFIHHELQHLFEQQYAYPISCQNNSLIYFNSGKLIGMIWIYAHSGVSFPNSCICLHMPCLYLCINAQPIIDRVMIIAHFSFVLPSTKTPRGSHMFSNNSKSVRRCCPSTFLPLEVFPAVPPDDNMPAVLWSALSFFCRHPFCQRPFGWRLTAHCPLHFLLFFSFLPESMWPWSLLLLLS